MTHRDVHIHFDSHLLSGFLQKDYQSTISHLTNRLVKEIKIMFSLIPDCSYAEKKQMETCEDLTRNPRSFLFKKGAGLPLNRCEPTMF